MIFQTDSQKAVYDRLWETPLAQIVATLDSDTWARPQEFEAAAVRLNRGNQQHRHQMTSFEQVLEQEFHGVALTCVEMLPDLVNALAGLERAMPISPEQIWTNALREMLKNPEHARRLPTAHIHATIHALFRWEYRDKMIVPNDLVDFRHAAAALGHCDALLTERGLQRTLTHRRRSLQEIHRRTVISDLDQAVDYLSLLRRQPIRCLVASGKSDR